MPIIKINNQDIHIQQLNEGAAETIVLVHGMLGNLSVYYFKIAPLLARHFHVVMYDLKSHGRSGKAADGYDLQSLTDDLMDLLQQLNLSSVYLAGYSFGGLISLKMAARFPALVKKLVLIEAPNPNDDDTRLMIDNYSRESLENYLSQPGQTKPWKRAMERKHRMNDHLFHETSIRKDILKEREFFSSVEIGELPQHTLLLYGTESPCLPAGMELMRKIVRAELFAMGGDHHLPLQEPERIASLMGTFFSDQYKEV